jgi:ankyrin repeat protein
MSSLLEPAAKGDLEAVKRILANEGGNVKESDKQGRTALLWAALNGKFKLVLWLLTEGGSNILEADEHGQTVWTHIKRRVQTAAPAELSLLLRSMVLLGDVPPTFLPYTETVPTPELLLKQEHGTKLNFQIFNPHKCYLTHTLKLHDSFKVEP